MLNDHVTDCLQDEEGEWEEVTETSPQPGTVFGFEQSNHDNVHPQGKKKRTHSKAGGSQQGHHQQAQNGAGGHNKHGNGHAHGHGNNGLHGHRAYGQVSKNIHLEQPLEPSSSPDITPESVERVVHVVFGVSFFHHPQCV
jgi:hypothetical protein